MAPVRWGGAGRSLKEAITSKLLPAGTCTVREGGNAGNVNRVGAYARRRRAVG